MPIMFGTHILHTVQPGETVYSLAVRYESTVESITRANALYPPFVDPYTIYQGQLLVIPKEVATETLTLYVIQQGDTIGALAQRFTADPELLVGINETIHNPNFILPHQQIHVPAVVYEVEEGDSLASISERIGVGIPIILQANERRLTFSPDVLYQGMRLIIPLPMSTNIVVTQPFPGFMIRDNQVITGYARAFEANVLYRVVDNNGVVVTEETFTTAEYGAPTYSRFRDRIPFDNQPTADAGVLQVYTRSAMDGSVQDLVEVRIRFDT
ncbi:LysM peptidoglycan-binding domain-containing protein [Desertibacillus haloalkaliphilus]|uniref:LysM peptidoglycan-binding domain-containing protein n=1 Tax=Desertibacillus haloalkaliphilus TaxID=1328930 RepID=UPI001C271FAE|nr:LysM peptidoglycan-binding domain-containing protein [Desertibacillus haloalkaliphilus]MBU8906510.1 LysM peptidoglycan-binding domain-containing protein [Desertibacillus haloalkaliphilus]